MMVATGVFLSTMDSSMINIALPSLMRYFDAPLVQVEWVVLAYLLTITTTLLVCGTVSDYFGKGRIYLIGMLVFSIGSLSCYFSDTLVRLIASRFLQALGASMMMSTGPAIIKLVFPREHLGKALGAIGVATSVGLVSGPMVGGFLLHYFSWRAIFLVTLPLNGLALTLGWIFLAGRVPKVKVERDVSFDWLGCSLWIVGIAWLVVLTSLFNHLTSGVKIIGIPLLVLLVYLFFRVEFRSQAPIFPIALLRKKYYGLAMLTAAMSFAILFSILILMPFYLDYILGLKVDTIGYVMMSVPLTLAVISPLSGWLYDRIGARILTTFGLLLCAAAILLLCALTPTSTPFDVAWRLCLLGTGKSIFLSPNTASVLAEVERRFTGVTSGMLATSRNLGMLGGVALAGMVFMGVYSLLGGGDNLTVFTEGQPEIFMTSFRLTLGGAACIALSGSLLSWLRTSEEDLRD